MGCCKRLDICATSSVALATPKMTEIFSRSMAANWPREASSNTSLATPSASSCAVSVAGTMFGGTPKSIGENSTWGKNPPRRA